MSIKILDTLTPAGNFAVSSAEHIAFTGEHASVQAALDDLIAIVKAEPELNYGEANSPYLPIKTINLGEAVILSFNVNTTSAGNCTVKVFRKLTAGGGDYEQIRQLTATKGLNTINLGSATELKDYTYKLSVVDALGKDAIYNNGELRQPYIEYRIICGNVQFASTFIETAKTNVFGTTTTQIAYPFSTNYAVQGYRWLVYKVQRAGDSSEPKLYKKLVSAEAIPGGTKIEKSINLDFDDGTFSETGTYTLTVYAAITETNNAATEDFLSIVSTSVVDTVEIMDANSVGITILTPIMPYTTESFISLDFVPKTNIAAYQDYNNLSAECHLYKIGQPDEKINDFSRVFNCTHGDTVTWSIGAIKTTSTYRMEVTLRAGSAATKTVLREFEIKPAQGEGTFYVREGLMFCFDANAATLTNDTFAAEETDGNTYEIRTSNLNEMTGIQPTYIFGSPCGALKLRGQAQGVLYKEGLLYNPWTVLADNSNTGMSFELFARSKCIGTLNSKIVSARNDNNAGTDPGFSIGYDTVRLDTAQKFTTISVLEDAWQHIVVTIDKSIRTADEDLLDPNDSTRVLVENFNPYWTARVYVDGTLVSCQQLDTKWPKMQPSLNFPLVLNGTSKMSINDINANEVTTYVQDHGECEIKVMRCYNRPLYSSEVYNNYLNALPQTARDPVLTRNLDGLTSIYFTKNKVDPDDLNYQAKLAMWDEKGLTNQDFKILHTIKAKKASDTVPFGSKTTLVNCTMHYCLNGEWGHETDVDVYLQGTSSLEYPVKNYQIKVFEVVDGVRKKKKILPPFKGAKDGWYIEDNVFTLKVDFMEQSHRNNTPTACFYQDEVLDGVIKSIHGSVDPKYYSPARQQTKVVSYQEDGKEVVKTVRPFRDAIDGFACVVYYNDNDEATDCNTLNDDNSYVLTAQDHYTGSFMFNVDKEGKQLGFELDCDKKAITDYSVYDPENSVLYDTNPLLAEDGSAVELKTLPCVSYEGGTNDNYSAGAFIPYEHVHEEQTRSIYESGNTIYGSDQKTEITYDSFDAFYSALDAGAVLYYKNDKGAFTKFSKKSDYYAGLDRYDYLEATLEPRYTFADDLLDDEVISKDTHKKLTYGPLERAINWVYTNSNNEATFRKEFSNYFSYEYCMTYYLQMMVFTQVDNAGKNAMFDTWGDGKLYPRPYDMDTQMGLDNSGQDLKLPSSELNLALSPSYISEAKVETGEFGKEHNAVKTWNTTTSKSHTRFAAYNTAESKLWKAFGKFFKKEIASCYIKMRGTGYPYSAENICRYIDQQTCDVIGEKFYNKDAVIKYLSYKANADDTDYATTYLHCLQGNRKNRYRQFITQRLIFLDTLFSHDTSITSGAIRLRANAPSQTSAIGIRVYSPQYIHIQVDAGNQADIIAFADPNDKYEYGGTMYSGTLFNIPTTGTDKNIVIYGAGNIQTINHTDDLNLTKFEIDAARKLTDIDLSGARSLDNLIFGQNTYIRNINISNTGSLATSLDLSLCENLETVIMPDSAVTGITFAPGANIKKLDLRNSGIRTLTLESLAMLDDAELILSGCTSLTDLSIIDCPKLRGKVVDSTSTLDLTTLNLTKFRLARCPQFTKVNLSGRKNIEKIELDEGVTYLNLSNCTGNVFKSFNISTLTNLTYLNLSSVSVNGTSTPNSELIIPNSSPYEYLDLSRAIIKKVYTPESVLANITDGTYDFKGVSFTQKTSKVLTFYANSTVKTVTNLVFVGYLYELFRSCTSLKELSDCTISAKSDTSSMYCMFYDCRSLETLGSVDTWSLDSVTAASHLFYNADKLQYSTLKSLLAKLPNVEALDNLLHGGSLKGTTVLGTDLFEKNTRVTSLSQAFYATNVTKVAGNGSVSLLTPIKNTLKNVYNMFGSCGSLTYVPQNLFTDCTKLENISLLFQGDSALGSTATDGGVPCIFSKTLTAFASTNNITSAYFAFYNCSNLAFNTTDFEQSPSLRSLMVCLPKLQNAYGMFYGCTKLGQSVAIPNGVLEANTALTNIDLMFSKTGITELPHNLFWTPSTGMAPTATHTSLTSARGLFADCRELTGIVHRYFFTPVPNLVAIGDTKKKSSGANLNRPLLINTTYISAPGMFANTRISGMHAEALSPLTRLKEASMLFYNGTEGAATTDSSRTFKPKKSSSQVSFSNAANPITEFRFYRKKVGTIEGTYPEDLSQHYNSANFDVLDGVIPKELFEKNTDLRYVNEAFAGNVFIEGIEKDALKSNTQMREMAGLFNLCESFTGIQDETETVPLYNLFEGKTLLTDISHLFAGCASFAARIDDEDALPFKDLTSLVNCAGTFMNSGIIGNVPAELFNSCRSTLQNVRYMFAGCTGLNGRVKTGYAIINDPDAQAVAYDTYLTNYYNQNKETTPRFVQDYADLAAFKTAALAGHYPKTLTDADVEAFYANHSNEELLQDYTSLEEFKTAVSTGAFKIVDNDFIDKATFLRTNININIIQPGLLADTLALGYVDHMFSGCKNLVGAIPADMFYLSAGRKNTRIASLSGLFADCQKLTLDSATFVNSKDNSVDSSTIAYYPVAGSSAIARYSIAGGGNYSAVYPKILVTRGAEDAVTIEVNKTGENCEMPHSFVPADWITGLTNITDISHIFFGVGAIRDASNHICINTNNTPFTYSALNLPNDLFRAQAGIKTAKNAFMQIPTLGRTTLNRDFLQNSLGSLTSVYRIFLGTKLKSIGTEDSRIFERKGAAINNTLNEVTSAFYRTNNIGYNANCFADDDKTDPAFAAQALTTTGLRTSFAPRFYDSTKFTNVDGNKLAGTFYATYVSPYYAGDSVNKSYAADYTNNTLNWSSAENYYTDVPTLTWSSLFNTQI